MLNHLSRQERSPRKQVAKSLSQKIPDKFRELSKKLRDYNEYYESLKEGANHKVKEDAISEVQKTIIEIIDLYNCIKQELN